MAWRSINRSSTGRLLVVRWMRVWSGQPLLDLGVEVRWRGESSAWQKRIPEIDVGPLHHSLGIRVVRAGLDHSGAQRATKSGYTGSQFAALTDT